MPAITEHTLRAADFDFRVRVYPADTPNGSVLVWLHGGGFMFGSVDMPEADDVSRMTQRRRHHRRLRRIHARAVRRTHRLPVTRRRSHPRGDRRVPGRGGPARSLPDPPTALSDSLRLLYIT